MSYQVLARKYRPTTFADLEGQGHVLQALVNALDNERLHHAYLFTGTRGVGKTTIARILARCLNCETGVTSKPCGECSACREISEGRSVDLIEVDAASRTGVDDMRELLDNVQYMPTVSRFKIYLIDEVHMLSRSSFNAMLKTLEEPPEHVKFLFATTDPKKLPITVLSRCLQFNLKNLSPEQIVHHLGVVLGKESIEFEDSALWQIGHAADGSMRDALSLTDQAISFGDNAVADASVKSMLGSVDTQQVYNLLDAVVREDGQGLLADIAGLSEFAPDYAGLLDDLLSILHRLAVAQAVPEAIDNAHGDKERVLSMATSISSEQVQLLYQIGLIGQRDLPLAPMPRIGFEMVLLRMMSFVPEAERVGPGGGGDRQSAETRAPIAANPTGKGAGVQGKAGGQSTASGDTSSSPIAGILSVINSGDNGQPVKTDSGQSDKTASANTESGPGNRPVASLAPVALVADPGPATGTVTSQSTAVSHSAVTTAAGPRTETAANGGNVAPGRAAAMLAQVIADGRIEQEVSEQEVAEKRITEERITEESVPEKNVPEKKIPEENVQAEVLAEETTPTQILVDNQPEQAPLAVQVSAVDLPKTESVSDNDKDVAPHASGKQLVPPILEPKYWSEVIQALQVTGVTRTLAANCQLASVSEGRCLLRLSEHHASLWNTSHEARISDALSKLYGQTISVSIEVGATDVETPAQQMDRERQENQAKAVQALESDRHVRALIQGFGGRLDPATISPVTSSLVAASLVTTERKG